MPRLFERVTIAGVGLIGGSLALAARQAGLIGEVIGLGRGVQNLEAARRRGIVDRYSHDPLEASRDADLLLLAVPVDAMASVAQSCAPALRPHATVSDVGSVKTTVVRAIEAVLPAGLDFVGAHPIAGTERSGAAAADARLFEGCRCVLTPSARSTAQSIERIRALWEGVGMRVDTMEPERHDATLAWVSHLPHAIAFAFVNALAAADPRYAAFAGPSFRSLTRVVASAPQMWSDILLANVAPVDAALGGFADALQELRNAIQANDRKAVLTLLQRAHAAHVAWCAPDAVGGKDA